MIRRLATRLGAWAAANAVPLVLVPLAAVFIWVAIWKVWLPAPSRAPAVARVVTTVDADAGTRPTHKVTSVERTTAAAAPARRSEVLVLTLLFLGTGIAVVGVFHDRIGSIELDRTGIKIALNKEEKDGAAELVDQLTRSGAGTRTITRGLGRYLRAVAARRSPGLPAAAVTGAPAAGLSSEEARALASHIATDLL